MNAAIEFFAPHHDDCTCDSDPEHCMSESHVSVNMDAVTAVARACAQGWANETNEYMKRRWIAPIPMADQNYLEMEVLGRPATEEESAEFSRVFIDEFNACIEQKAEREGWDAEEAA